VYGVRYPDEARRELAEAGARYQGWLPNSRVPEVLAGHHFTLHVPRRAYVRCLPGIPTIRPFEALACGMPLVSAPWDDAEGLFAPGVDHLVARDGLEMRRHMRALVFDGALRQELREHGRATVLARHTCAHRVEQLLAILSSFDAGAGKGLS
jgi:spore maturation protein CgeB